MKISALVRATRPRQWIKNVFVLAALVFSGQLADPASAVRGALAFACFCALSSAVYLFNDVRDRELDRLHPEKRLRPIASGELSPVAASAAAVLLAAAALALAFALSPAFASTTLLYLALHAAYSLGLRRVVILDVMLVAAGFLIRAWAGAVAIGVETSHWLALCTGLLARFLGVVKRRQEIVSLGGAAAQRPILREYSVPFLDQMISVVTASTVLAYSLYAFSGEVAERVGTRHLGLTIPFVLFGIFRFLYLVHQRGEGENASVLVVSDRAFLLNLLLWGAAVVLAVYVWR